MSRQRSSNSYTNAGELHMHEAEENLSPRICSPDLDWSRGGLPSDQSFPGERFTWLFPLVTSSCRCPDTSPYPLTAVLPPPPSVQPEMPECLLSYSNVYSVGKYLSWIGRALFGAVVAFPYQLKWPSGRGFAHVEVCTAGDLAD
ncbi:hypothetical protein Bbelb_389320 [Branchiostoma belcheri]|nr:hypothetical protein Bbelb_389320 [Branchiostoma belcheri]